MGIFDGGDGGGITGMLSGMFGGGQQPTDPNAPMQILPQVQQDAMAGPSFLDTLKANFAKNNGSDALSNMAMQMARRPQQQMTAPQPLNIPQWQRPNMPAYGSLAPFGGGR
jgi:hypothetical protein